MALKVSQHPSKFGGYGHYGTGDIIVLVCHVISRDYIIKRSCDFKGRNLSKYVTILPSLVAIDTLVSET